MLSSNLTQKILTISYVIFCFSFISFVYRVWPFFQISSISSKDSYQEFHPFNDEEQKFEHKSNIIRLRSSRHDSNYQHQNDSSLLGRFSFINPSRQICDSTKYSDDFLILLILSRAQNLDFRQTIRATWGRKGTYKNYGIRVQPIFFVGTDDRTQSSIRLEQSLFEDVVLIDIPEAYPFVAHKELASLYWTRLNCPSARFVFRADDDIFLDIFLLLHSIKYEVNLEKQDGIHGWFRFNNAVHRTDKWAVTKREYPASIYPPYTFGIGYLLSNRSCQRLVDAAALPGHKVIRIGDVYITGILRELANISYYDFLELEYVYTFFQELDCNTKFQNQKNLLICLSKLHVGVRNDPFEFYDIWEIIVAKHNISIYDVRV